MGSSSSKLVENNQKFVINTTAYINTDEKNKKEINAKAYDYLNSNSFRKIITYYLNSNFMEEGKIKILIDSIKITKALKVIIHGTIRVIKKESEDYAIVKSVLESAIPHYSLTAEHIPKKAKFSIKFKESSTDITM